MPKLPDTRDTPEKRDKWREPFLKALAVSGNVLVACRSARVARKTAYRHRDRFPKFRDAWEEAIEEATDALEGEARRRATSGTEKAVFYKGKQVATVREYSDTLLIFLLKAHRPEKFRDNFDLKKLIDELRVVPGQAAPASGQPHPAPKPPPDPPKGGRAGG